MNTNRKTILHLWDTRWKSVTFIILIFCSAMLQEVQSLLLLQCIPLIFIVLSKMPMTKIFSSLKPILIFLVIMGAILIVTVPGESMGKLWGSVSLSEDGLMLWITIALRTIAIIEFTMILFYIETIDTFCAVLYIFHIPSLIITLIHFTYRFVLYYKDLLLRMKIAATLRGYSTMRGLGILKSISNVVTTMLIQGYEQSDRVFTAMQMRGFTGSIPYIHTYKTKCKDVILTLSFLFYSFGLVILEKL